MEETRVSKYKDYRAQLIREGAPKLSNNGINSDNSSLDDTLNTKPLPINEVYDTLANSEKEQEGMLALEKNKTILKYTFLSIFLLILTAGIIIFAIFAFKK